MITIVEGPDGSGKTSLIKNLAFFSQMKVIHNGPLEDPFWTYAKNLLEAECRWKQKSEAVRTNSMATVFDRFWPSEVVYGNALRGICKLSIEGQKILAEKLDRLGAVYVVCLPPIDVVLRNWEKNIENELVKKQSVMEDIYHRYCDPETFEGVDTGRVIPYDYTQPHEMVQVHAKLLKLHGVTGVHVA